MTKHLATFNMFREDDGSLWVTVMEASGVKDELGDAKNLPVYHMAMQALVEAMRQMQDRKLEALSQPK